MYRLLKNNRIFFSFISSYFLILVLTVGIGILTQREVNKMIQADYVQTAVSSLEKGKELLETRLNEVDGIITQLTLDSSVKYLNQQYQLDNKDYYDLRVITNKLHNYTLTNKFIDEIYIYWEKPGIIVSSASASQSPSAFYENFLQYEGMSFEGWKARLADSDHNRNMFPAVVDKDGKKGSYLTYYQTYNNEIDPTTRVTFLVLIKEDTVSSSFNYMEMLKGGSFLLSDSGGMPILSINNRTVSNGKSSIELQVASELRGWNYTAAVPISYLERKAVKIKRMFEYAAIIELLAGLLAIVVVSYRHSLPLKKMAATLNKAFASDNQNLRGIEGKISQLVVTNKDMQTRLDAQLPLVRASFMERLLRGSIRSEEEIEAYLIYSEIHLHGELYTVTVVELLADRHVTVEIIKDLEILRTNALELLDNIFSEDALLHSMDDRRIAILHAYRGEWAANDMEDKLAEQLDQVLLGMYHALGIQVVIGVGTMCSSVMEASRSFQEACKALENRYIAGVGSVVWYGKLNYTYAGYYYPLEDEQRLINYTRNGEAEATREQLHRIIAVNLQERSLTDGDKQQLYYEIRGTILKIKEDLLLGQDDIIAVIDECVRKMDRSRSDEELFAAIEMTFTELCQVFSELKLQRQASPIQKMLDIVHGRFTDKNFYLHHLADEFQLSEKYLSHYFKDQTGENFSNYLERLRLDKAVELMGDESLTISVIAEQAGYDRTNTFYRAFKRKFGLSPSAYRERRRE